MAQHNDPLRTRNLNPPVAIFLLPTWQPHRSETTAGVTMEVANHYRLSRRGDDFLLLDGETLRANFHFERPFAEHWSVAAEVPIVHQYGGVLDDVIDGWHSLFRLPDGGRNARPESVIDFRIGTGNTTFLQLGRSESALGDTVLSVARGFGADGSFTLRMTVKADTGDEQALAGSGASDAMVTLLRSRPVQLRRRSAAYYWGFGLVAPGTPTVIGLPVEDTVAVAVAGGAFGVRANLGFKGQVEVHTPFYDTPLEELGQTSVQASIGGWWSFSDRARLDFAVSEDLHVSTAPDVVLHAGVQWQW